MASHNTPSHPENIPMNYNNDKLYHEDLLIENSYEGKQKELVNIVCRFVAIIMLSFIFSFKLQIFVILIFAANDKLQFSLLKLTSKPQKF